MENFFYESEFYTDLGHLMDGLGIEEDCSNIDDDWKLECKESSLEKLAVIDAQWIIDHIDDERFSEEGSEIEKMEKSLSKIDFTAINDCIPQLYYETKNKFLITKKDLIEYCN